jgi:uncharacterized protein
LIELGQMNELIVHKEDQKGFILNDPISDDTAFLPPISDKIEINIDDRISVFVYLDNDNNMIASIERPYATVGEYALLTAVESLRIGAFFDWGISKDLFVPDNEQRERIYEGDQIIIRACLDERTEKVYGTTKIGKYIKASQFDIKEGDKVSIIPARKEELGYRSIINKKYIGMIYYNEIFKSIKIGEKLQGVVKKIREDGLVDTSLQTQGFQNLVDSKDKILAYLKEGGGESHLHDKSSPQEIKEILGMSKQTFKNTIGMLYRDRKIIITKAGIKLV